MPKKYHLAQVNIAKMLAPIDDALMADFVARLDDINALAERSPGFVWRLKTDVGNATELRPYDDKLIIVNLSVWESPEHLRSYVYRSDHTAVMRQRRKWFERFEGMYYALWWIPASHEPSVEEAKQRLDYLQTYGESPRAFLFTRVFSPPGTTSNAPLQGFSDTCPAI